MRKLILLLSCFTFVTFTFSQTSGINYKALIKDGSGNTLSNQGITIQFSILQGAGMTSVYQEIHTPTTDANGIVIVNIGLGSIDSGVFNDINWGGDDHFLNVQINTGSGLVDMGTTQFMAVPYALSSQSIKSETIKLNDLFDVKSDSDGSNNGSSVFIGINAGLNDDASDNNNVGVGYNSLSKNASGTGNIGLGYQSLFNNIDGNVNLAIGLNAMYNNTSGHNNVGVGFRSLWQNTIGNGNVAVGNYSLADNTEGIQNTALGYFSLYNNINGLANTSVGRNSLYNNTEGDNNVGIGSQTLESNISGDENVAIGSNAGQNNEIGNNNIFIGAWAGAQETGSNKLYIESQIFGEPLIYGEFDNNVLRTNGEFQIGNPSSEGYSFPKSDGSNSQILQTDGNGNVSWVDNSSSFSIDKLNDLADAKSDDDGSNDGSSVFIGINAGLNDDGTDNKNVGIGFESLKNSNGLLNVATGYKSLSSNTNGFANIGFGANTLEENTSGNYNTAVGTSALNKNTEGDSNTAIGQGALFNNTLGYFNTAIGNESLSDNTIGNNNCAFGWQALDKNISGVNNIAFGNQALRFNEVQNDNTAVGVYALRDNVNGTGNTATGYSAHFENVHGDYNTAVGFEALKNSWLGNNNTALGYRALYGVTTGENNIAIGNDSQVPNATGNNQVRIGNTDITYAGIQVAWTVTSDSRWKENIRELQYGLDVVKRLKPVDYTRKNNENKTREMGFIAQDLEVLLDKIGYEDQGFLTKDDKGFMSVRYNDFIALLTKAIQEQQAIIENQNSEIKSLTAELESASTNQEELNKRLIQVEKILNTSSQ